MTTLKVGASSLLLALALTETVAVAKDAKKDKKSYGPSKPLFVSPPETGGVWETVRYYWPIVPVHSILLPNGKVLVWTREDHMDEEDNPLPEQTSDNVYVWDPESPTTYTWVGNPYNNMFCAGHAYLPDGRLLVAGGHYDDFIGTRAASIFDWTNNTWSQAPDMTEGRWYPTLTTLANGEILAVAGTIDAINNNNLIPDVFDGTSWRRLTTASLDMQFYPWMFVAPGGNVFRAGMEAQSYFLDTSSTGAWTSGPVTNHGLLRFYGSAVQYGFGQILIAGGDSGDLVTTSSVTDSAEVIDLSDTTPAWRTVDPMGYPRKHFALTLLADGSVLASGGQSGLNGDSTQVLTPEIWDPFGEEWSPMNAMDEPRRYHSSTILLPDGRVFAAGGGISGYPGDPTNYYSSQIFSPPYLFKGDRPVITSAPSTIEYQSTLEIETPDPDIITGVNLIRLGAMTHAFDQSQRSARLGFTRTETTVVATTPYNGNEAPPGYYMLFITASYGTPSIAKIIKLE